MYPTRSFTPVALVTILMVLLLGSIVPTFAQTPEEPHPAVTTAVTDWLTEAAPTDTQTFIVDLKDDDTTTQLTQTEDIVDKQERRTQVVDILDARATRDEQALRAFLRSHDLEAAMADVQVFLSSSSLAITATPETIKVLQEWERVHTIDVDQPITLDPPIESSSSEAEVADIQWNISKIGADKVWSKLQLDGDGITVGSLDTGVLQTHKDLSANYKCAGSSNHSSCWSDQISDRDTPNDDNGHGTHTVGTAVGRNGIGVAPGAQWIACKAFDSTGKATEASIKGCFSWFLRPGGNAANAPDIIINSWSTDGNNTTFQADVNSWISAGIYPVFANGNLVSVPIPPCQTVRAPASYSNTVGVGSTDDQDVMSSFSTYGPSPLTGNVKPDMTAPGEDIASASNASDSSYRTLSGTSMATPHVAGLAALLLDGVPSLSVSQVTTIMKQNALRIDAKTPCSESDFPNNEYGWGRIRAYESVQASGAPHRFFNFDTTTGYAPLPDNGHDLTTISRYADGPCQGRTAGTCVFDTRVFNGNQESITAYGKYFIYDVDQDYQLVASGDLTSISRYTERGGPCHGKTPGTCTLDTRTLFGNQESITAYGQYFIYDVDQDYQLIASGDLTSISRYTERGGPCHGKTPGTCTFDTRTTLFGNQESITAYGQYFIYDVNQDYQLIASGDLTSISRYTERGGPCQNKSPGTCKLHSRSFFTASNEHIIEAITN